ncbi:hypothetical protein PM682P4_00015 [Parabacteroides phage PM682P4]|nr:hypothetical protein PM682P4_00015 [Parabacteroides phage PM682P4]
MKAMLKNCRLSFVKLFEATQINGMGEFNYSCALLIPKDSPEGAKLQQIHDAEIKAMIAKYPKLKGQMPKNFASVVKDGDEMDYAGYAGNWAINVKRKQKDGRPILINGHKQVITEPNELYSGCYANVSVNFSSYENTGKYGISCWLNGVQKAADGERLDGGSSVDDFDEIEPTDEDLDKLFS